MLLTEFQSKLQVQNTRPVHLYSITYLKILDNANLHYDARGGFTVKAKKYGASFERDAAHEGV